MKLSFEDKESFKENVGSLHFDRSPSDPDILGGTSSSSQERSEDK